MNIETIKNNYIFNIENHINKLNKKINILYDLNYKLTNLNNLKGGDNNTQFQKTDYNINKTLMSSIAAEAAEKHADKDSEYLKDASKDINDKINTLISTMEDTNEKQNKLSEIIQDINHKYNALVTKRNANIEDYKEYAKLAKESLNTLSAKIYSNKKNLTEINLTDFK
jgi:hypothetical protein